MIARKEPLHSRALFLLPTKGFNDIPRQALTIGIQLPVSGAPAFQETMKIGPGQGEKSSPLLLYCFCFNGWLSSCQCLLELCEVAIQQPGFLSLTLPFNQTTA